MKRKTNVEKIKRLWNRYRETIVYLIVGGIVSCVNWILYTILSTVLLIDVNISNIIAWLAAVFTAFFLNKVLVFQSLSWDRNIIHKEFISFVSGRIFTGVIEIGMVPLLLHLGLDAMLFGIVAGWAKAVACVIGVILNYFLSKYFIFTK